ncbi:MAG: hypothetical protein IKW89_10980 [Bacteroidales bacterium]|nr:hypothetical protein [Bacteroidales bacterium]
MNTKATYEPAGKEYFVKGDTIKVVKISYFLLEEIIFSDHVSQEEQLVEHLEGTYEVSELFRLAKTKQAIKDNQYAKEKGLTPPASTRLEGDKALNDTLVLVVAKMKHFLDNPSIPIFECGRIEATRKGQIITVQNMGENSLYIDIIWVVDDQCFSALSYANDFVSDYPLSGGNSLDFSISKYAEDAILFVIGSPVPIPYNIINFGKFDSDGHTHGESLPISICKVSMQ